MRNKNKENRRTLGFTIIESMVVVAIIGILIVGGLIKRKQNIDREKVETGANQVKAMIDLARDHALTGETIDHGGNKVVPEKFCFKLTSGTNFSLHSVNPDQGPLDGQTETLNSDIEAETANVNICYNIPNAEMTCSESPCKFSLCTKDDCDASMRYTITVTDNTTKVD